MSVKPIPEDMHRITPHLVCAGAKLTMPVADMFWGDRYGKIEDPFGHQWSLATQKRHVSMDDARKAMAGMK